MCSTRTVVVHVGNAVNKLSDGHTGAEEDESELGENLKYVYIHTYIRTYTYTCTCIMEAPIIIIMLNH